MNPSTHADKPSPKLTDIVIAAAFHCLLTGLTVAVFMPAFARNPGAASINDNLGMAASKLLMMPLALPALMAGHWHVGVLLFPLNSFVCAVVLMHLVAIARHHDQLHRLRHRAA